MCEVVCGCCGGGVFRFFDVVMMVVLEGGLVSIIV